jgi:tetratricopeptide (TPR) repeat protein
MLAVAAWLFVPPRAPSAALTAVESRIQNPESSIEAASAPVLPDTAGLADEQSPAELLVDVASNSAPVHWAADPQCQAALARLERAQQALASDPKHPQALRDRAAALAELHAWPQLAATLARLVELNPQDAELRFEHAAALMRSRQWIDALCELKIVVAAQPGNAKAWFNFAVAHQALGHLADARQAWDQALKLSPTDEAHARRGEVLLDLHEWSLAVADFEAVLQREPGSVDATLNLTLALVKLGRLDEARERLLAALESHPQHVPILNRLAELAYVRCESASVDDRTACQEAAEWCQRSLALDPEQPDVQSLLTAVTVADQAADR